MFPSIKAAAEFVGTYMSGISGCVRGITTTCAGYHWEYVDEEMRMQSNKPENLRRPPRKTIEDVQKEAERRSRETGRRVRYRHIQIEETLELIRQRDKLERLKREAKR